MSKAVVALVRNGNIVYLLMDKNDKKWCIKGWENIKQALQYFEGSYKRSHGRSYEASMSACINFIQFQWRVVEFESLEILTQKLLDPQNLKLKTIGSVSGQYVCLECESKAVDVYEKEGVQPQLI